MAAVLVSVCLRRVPTLACGTARRLHRFSASDGDLSDHDVADPADAGASVVANGTPTQVRQRDHLIADGPADGDLVAQRGSQPPVIRWRTLIRVRHSVPCPGVFAPVVDSCLVAEHGRNRPGHPRRPAD